MKIDGDWGKRNWAEICDVLCEKFSFSSSYDLQNDLKYAKQRFSTKATFFIVDKKF